MNELLKHTLKTVLILFVIIFVLRLAETYAQSLEEHYTALGFSQEQIAEMQRQANLEWQQEHSDLQPNLTPEIEKYLKKSTALLQEKINE
ncbi:hypothetical protein [Avibacterium sp. 21-594]|uniref:hypothetical protein n=1 Tax=Avibacterium sp. 21-594 TaxID=2911535 RepID=UPI002246AB6B|nr:hypothetical protein [Avibacterium sp. 21-594]MCW9716794.1 hypothetical protein [Avibacterium sp. 21-594]